MNNLPVIRIQPSKGWVSLKLSELWEYRELLYFLTWRDIKVRYKQTVLGATWAIIQPFFTMVVFSLFFGKLAIAIKVEGLSKLYRIGGKQERYKTLREKLSALNSDLINDPITNDQ